MGITHGVAQYDPEKWPLVSLHFSETGTLRDIFDAGMRPYRFPGLEKAILEVKHVRVAVVQRSGTVLPDFPAELIEIHPLQDGLLYSIEMTRYKTSLEEARALMLPYLPRGPRSAQDLDIYLSAVRANYLDYDGMGKGVDDFSVRWSESNGPRYVVVFQKAFDPIRPLILVMSIDWSQMRTPKQKRSFYKEPIPPPPGYEQESMQAPLKFGPDSQADILLSQGKPIAGDRPPPIAAEASTQNLPLETPTPPLPTTPVTQTPALPAERELPVWPWVVGVFALVAVVAFALKRRA